MMDGDDLVCTGLGMVRSGGAVVVVGMVVKRDDADFTYFTHSWFEVTACFKMSRKVPQANRW